MIKIRVVSYNNEPPPSPQEAVFGREGASIGREKGNLLVLPDPKRYVSRQQAVVKSDGQRHTIVNLSQANPILVNGDEVGLGMEIQLRPGDEIQIGLYLLRAEPAESGAANAPSLATPALAPEAATLDVGAISGDGADPFADLLGGANDSAVISAAPLSSPVSRDHAAQLGSSDEFDDLLGAPAPSTARVVPSPAQILPFGFDDLLAAPIPPLPDKPSSIIPEDFDPFALPSSEHGKGVTPFVNIAANDVSLESIGGKDDCIDSLLARDRTDGTSQLDPGSLDHTASETDPLRLFGSDSLLAANGHQRDFSQPALDQTPEIRGYFAMPQMISNTAASRDPVPIMAVAQATQAAPAVEERMPPKAVPLMPPSPPASVGVAVAEPPVAPPGVAPLPDELAQAFLRGAGLPADIMPNGVTPEWMEMIGKFVATATQGTIDLIASRALVKREVKADVTVIAVRNNNPLKFLPDADSALMQMLGKKISGFMGPTDAMQDAYLDLRAHQIGVLAGMRAALAEVLKRFDPVQLESRLKRKTVLDSLMASNRKGKLWDLYGELFKDIYVEAQDDFQTLFGKAFVAAYEAEVERFSKEAAPGERHG